MRTESFLLMDIAFSVSDQSLSNLLTPYGEIRELWYPKDALGVPFGYAFVTMAIHSIENSPPHRLGGRDNQNDESIAVFGEHTLIFQILARNRWTIPSAHHNSS